MLTIFMAPVESVFAAQYALNPTIPENNSVTLSYFLGGTGLECLNSFATEIGRTEYSSLVSRKAFMKEFMIKVHGQAALLEISSSCLNQNEKTLGKLKFYSPSFF